MLIASATVMYEICVNPYETNVGRPKMTEINENTIPPKTQKEYSSDTQEKRDIYWFNCAAVK